MEQVYAILALFGFFALFPAAFWVLCWCLTARCPVCGSKRTTITYSAKFYDTWRCHRCDYRWDLRTNDKDLNYGG